MVMRPARILALVLCLGVLGNAVLGACFVFCEGENHRAVELAGHQHGSCEVAPDCGTHAHDHDVPSDCDDRELMADGTAPRALDDDLSASCPGAILGTSPQPSLGWPPAECRLRAPRAPPPPAPFPGLRSVVLLI